VRLLNTGQVNKNDPNDARSVAVAALRTHAAREVVAEDDTAVMKLWARRYQGPGQPAYATGLPAARGALRPGPGWVRPRNLSCTSDSRPHRHHRPRPGRRRAARAGLRSSALMPKWFGGWLW
jgi:hypothetical protein